MAYSRISTQDGITRMNTELYNNLQDGIDELKSDQFGESMFGRYIICQDSKAGGLLLKYIRGRTTQGENPSYTSPQTLIHGGSGGINYSVLGRNLIQFGNSSSVWNGITYTKYNGRVMVSGKSTTATNTESLSSFTDLPEGEYFLSGCPAGGNINMHLQAEVRYNNGETQKYYDYGSGVKVPIMSGLKTCNIRIVIGIDNPVYNQIFEPVFSFGVDKHKFAVGAAQTLTFPITVPLRGVPVYDVPFATHVDENGKMWCDDEINVERGVTTRRIGVTNVSITSVITLDDGRCAGVCAVSDKKDGSGFGCLCDRASYDADKSRRTGTFYEDGKNVIFIGDTTDTLDTLKTKYNNASLIYIMSSPRESAIDSSKLIEVYGLLSHENMIITCGSDNIDTIVEYPTTDCAGITGLSYNMIRHMNIKSSIVNAVTE